MQQTAHSLLCVADAGAADGGLSEEQIVAEAVAKGAEEAQARESLQKLDRASSKGAKGAKTFKRMACEVCLAGAGP